MITHCLPFSKEGAYLQFPSSILLHFDPQERSQVVEETHAASAASLQELEEHVD